MGATAKTRVEAA